MKRLFPFFGIAIVAYALGWITKDPRHSPSANQPETAIVLPEQITLIQNSPSGSTQVYKLKPFKAVRSGQLSIADPPREKTGTTPLWRVTIGNCSDGVHYFAEQLPQD